MNMKSAFLNGDLREEVYVSQPPGFIVKGQEQNVYKLHKALYGLRQAPKAWNSKLDTVLYELGFSKCKTEYELYIQVKNKKRLIVGVYVDDLIIMGESDQELNLFMKDQRRRPEGGEWEPIKIPHRNSAYILKSTRTPLSSNSVKTAQL
jgi:hypothetical protein